jgi:hypothetical protein
MPLFAFGAIGSSSVAAHDGGGTWLPGRGGINFGSALSMFWMGQIEMASNWP